MIARDAFETIIAIKNYVLSCITCRSFTLYYFIYIYLNLIALMNPHTQARVTHIFFSLFCSFTSSVSFMVNESRLSLSFPLSVILSLSLEYSFIFIVYANTNIVHFDHRFDFYSMSGSGPCVWLFRSSFFFRF